MRPKVHKSMARRLLGGIARLGLLGGLRSIEINPQDFRRELWQKHGIRVMNFGQMRQLPIEKLDAVAAVLIRDAQRLALAEGAGWGLGGAITILPDLSILTVLTLRLIQRLCLLYGCEARGPEERVQLWLTAAAAAGVDYGKEFAEKQMAEKIAPRVAARLAAKIGGECAEKWAGRFVPLASSAIGGALNYGFVRTWGRRVQRHLRERHRAQSQAA